MSDTKGSTERPSARQTDDEAQQSRSPEEIQAEIEQTRQELGETVDALSARLDVKTRAREKVAASRQQATDQWQHARERARDTVAQGKDAATDEHGSLKPAVPAAAGAAALVAVAIGILVWRRRR